MKHLSATTLRQHADALVRHIGPRHAINVYRRDLLKQIALRQPQAAYDLAFKLAYLIRGHSAPARPCIIQFRFYGPDWITYAPQGRPLEIPDRETAETIAQNELGLFIWRIKTVDDGN